MGDHDVSISKENYGMCINRAINAAASGFKHLNVGRIKIAEDRMRSDEEGDTTRS
jgi:hypothetical protein